MDLPLILALVAIAVFGVLGYRDGVIKRIIEIAGVFVALILTARFATSVSPWVMDQTGAAEGPALLMTWAGLFIAGLILSRLLAKVLSKLVRLTILGSLDKIGGAVVGMAFGTLVISVILVALSQVPGAEGIQPAYDRNPAGRFIFYAAPNVYRSVQGLGGGKVDDVWDRVLETTKGAADTATDQVGGALDKTADDLKEDVEKKVREKLDDAG